MVGNELGILTVGAVVVSSVEYAYCIVLLRQIAEESAETGLVFFFQLRAGRHVEKGYSGSGRLGEKRTARITARDANATRLAPRYR
jgi:hypothetical protein